MTKSIDLTGQRFNMLTVIKRNPDGKRWDCVCDCGNRVSAIGAKLKSGHTKSCGCYKARLASERVAVDYTGVRVGRLLVVERSTSKDSKGRSLWEANCECGSTIQVTGYYLRTSKIASCGCAKREASRKRRFNDLSGLVFSKLTVLKFVEFDRKRKAVWRCSCFCGSIVDVRGASLVSGRTHSCGCASKDSAVYSSQEELGKSAARCAMRRARLRNAGGKYTHEQIQELFKKQRGMCAWCSTKLKKWNLARDHRRSLKKNGSNHIHNIELLCTSCNQRKNAKDEIAWANECGRLI